MRCERKGATKLPHLQLVRTDPTQEETPSCKPILADPEELHIAEDHAHPTSNQRHMHAVAAQMLLFGWLQIANDGPHRRAWHVLAARWKHMPSLRCQLLHT